MTPLERVKEQFAAEIIETHAFRGDETAIIRPASLLGIAKFLKETPELDFNFLMDLTAVDYLSYAGGSLPREWRFEVVYHFYSLNGIYFSIISGVAVMSASWIDLPVTSFVFPIGTKGNLFPIPTAKLTFFVEIISNIQKIMG